MKRWRFTGLLGLLLLVAAASHLALARASRPPQPPARPQRIVSLAPSITETLFALGLGGKVAGVTRYCEYPPEALRLPRVAGFSDINYEAVLRIRPDLVVLPEDKALNRLDLERLGLPVLALNIVSLSGLMRSIAVLGRATDREDAAAALLASLRGALDDARRRAEGRRRPVVLFSVMRSYQGLGRITEIHAVGRDGFYSELIEAAGGRNAYTGMLPYPRLSREAVITLNPDVIVDVIPGGDDLEGVRRDWQSLSSVSAVKNGRVFLFADPADTVPGPRFARTLAKLSRILHPDPRAACAPGPAAVSGPGAARALPGDAGGPVAAAIPNARDGFYRERE